MKNYRLENRLIKPHIRFEPTIEDEQNYDLLTKNTWKVNKEKTFDWRIKGCGEFGLFDIIENEKNIKDFTLSFDAKNNIYSLKRNDFEEIGIFETINNLNFLMKNKENTQNVEILFVDENICILNFDECVICGDTNNGEDIDYYNNRFKELYFLEK